MKNIFLKEMTDHLAYKQFDKCCEHPAFRKGALMPDAHGGYDAPIGSVIALKNWVVPSWVGYDIGCGMCAVQLDIKKEALHSLKALHSVLHEYVPCGEHAHATDRLFNLEINRDSEAIKLAFEKRKVEQQFGTLGSGNHFLELGLDSKERAWIVIHSGSRGFGHEVATYWMREQKEHDNIGFYLSSKKGQAYLHDLYICLRYALENRKTMIDQTILAIKTFYGIDVNMVEGTFINRNHNHMERAHDLCIHRKGATHAEKGMMGVIPANMKDGAFIVRGLGNPESLWSSSHGAGRLMSRTAAQKEIKLEDFIKEMKDIVGDVREDTLDEAPSAYKNIADVMAIQVENNILEIIDHIRPILNIKG